MGGIVVFQWGEGDNNQLTLLMNRDNFKERLVSGASWDILYDDVLSARCKRNQEAWFAISKRGRVAFLMDTEPFPVQFYGPESLTHQFVEGQDSPEVFARDMADHELHMILNTKMAFNLIVADINSKSMFYISKLVKTRTSIVETQVVGPGIHTLSLYGLDYEADRELRLKHNFREMINRERLPPLRELAEIMYDRVQYDEEDPLSSIFLDIEVRNKRFGTTSTTALVVKRTKEVMLFERFMEENGAWKTHDFAFNIQ